MPLRSGKEYLKPHKCNGCCKYYSYEKFGYKCSECSPLFKKVETNDQRREKLEAYIQKHTVTPDNKQLYSLIEYGAKKTDLLLFVYLLHLRRNGYFLKAEHACKMVEGGGVCRGHIVAAHVGDWWNIQTCLGWPPYLVCYYGDFDNKKLPKYPPRMPRHVLHCTETIPMLDFLKRNNPLRFIF